MTSASDQRSIDTVLFDFGGVLAAEGFRNGLAAIGKISGLPEESVIRKGHELVIETGYVTGRAREARWWDALRIGAGVRGTDEELRREILDRFALRPWMLEQVKKLKDRGFTVGILSDQTNWLDELDIRFGFYGCFHFVFNSYHMGKSKHDPTHFDDVLKLLKREGQEVLFIDDNPGHVGRAESRGWKTLLYKNRDDVLRVLAGHLQGQDADRPPR
ncbi:MAG TPA: HAD family phosphatase [Syntrophales bacterium]|nr:HAD family phosphatase [Syntrophales bacterium]